MVTQTLHDDQQWRRMLWSWLRGALSFCAADGQDRRYGQASVAAISPQAAPCLSEKTGSAEQLLGAEALDVQAVSAEVLNAEVLDTEVVVADSVVLRFPIHGEALLVRLADLLRSRLADRSPEHDPLLFTMSRGLRSRLSIDRMAYVEFHNDRAEFRVAIEASPQTKVILETADFDAVVDFVGQYISARLAELPALEVAS
jgi:hypothetical protein